MKLRMNCRRPDYVSAYVPSSCRFSLIKAPFSEETSEDVRARARAIQENEIQQLRDLTSFLDVEMNFAQQYLEVLQDVKSNWCDTWVLSCSFVNSY
jgi:hypothetical protein